MKKLIINAIVFLCLSATAFSLDPTDPGLFVRVIDVGAGHSAVILFPDNSCVVYDAGNYTDNGASAYNGLTQILAPGQHIDLMIISHSDSDHIAATTNIIENYSVSRVVRSGLDRTGTATWEDMNRALEEADTNNELEDYNLAHDSFNIGEELHLGGAVVTLVHGWHKPPWWYGILSSSEERNAGSIVIRVEYEGRSVLFTGDSVGRHTDDPVDTLIASEERMVDYAGSVPIDSDVLIAAHHGADNGSALPFVEEVSPEFVIFPAGNGHGHPRKTTAERIMLAGVAQTNMFRTDLGSDENVSGSTHGHKEWTEGNSTIGDTKGDDDVDILITPTGDLFVEYRHP